MTKKINDKKSHIIFLNGTSSVGKTSTARELQNILGPKWLYLTMDHFLDMLSRQIFNLDSSSNTFLQKNQGLYASKKSDGTFDVEVGPLGKKILHDMHDTVNSLLQNEWNVIFTVVAPEKDSLYKMRESFKTHDPYFVYLYADKEIVIKRERDRANRLVGHTVNLLEKYNCQDLHNLKIDTGKLKPTETAQRIKLEFQKNIK